MDAGPRRDAGPPDAGPPRDAGRGRPALRFTRSTYFEVEDAASFDQRFEFAYELWVRPRSLADGEFCAKGDGTARHLIAGIQGGFSVLGWQVGLTSYYFRGAPLPIHQWTHLALVARLDPAGGGHNVIAYVDGNEVGRATFPRLADAFNDVEFSCGRADVDVDEIRVWRVARTQADIRANMTRRLSGALPGLVVYYRLDESGQIVLDYATGSNPGVLGSLTTPDPADPMWILDGPF